MAAKVMAGEHVNMPPTMGRRVFVFLSATSDAVNVVGSGTYVGETIPDPTVTPHPLVLGLAEDRLPISTIALDGGGHIYGCECWYVDEDRKDAVIAGRAVVPVDLMAARQRMARQMADAARG